jgi:entericidin B
MKVERTITRALPWLVIAVTSLGGVAACNTIEGAGEDIEDAGEAIQDAADD